MYVVMRCTLHRDDISWEGVYEKPGGRGGDTEEMET